MLHVTVSASGIGDALRGRVSAAAQEVGRAVIASCEPFVPYNTGELCGSSSLETVSENEVAVVYRASHAAECYYANRPFNRRHHPQACSHWFEAAKAVDLERWAAVAAGALTGGDGR